MKWTDKQQEVIEQRNKGILVSAAAGAGKTAVLVERIIQMVLDEKDPMDVDEILVVTFTRAAAAEMRERITQRIGKELEEHPEDAHLKRQSSLIHNASIMTIDSFCLSVIRNYFYRIDLDPSFRIAEEGEIKLLQQDVLAQMLEEEYEKAEEGFLSFVRKFGSDRDKTALPSLILQVYESAMSEPWPKKWLEKCREEYQVEDLSQMGKAPWMEDMLKSIGSQIDGMADSIGLAAQMSEGPGGPAVYGPFLYEEQEMLEEVAEKEGYGDIQKAVLDFSFGKLPACRDKEVDKDLQEQVKKIRNKVKADFGKLRDKYLAQSPEEAFSHIRGASGCVQELCRLTEEFIDRFSAEKRQRGILDFTDQEHYALEILVDEETQEPTEAARELQGYYREIMIDEYQDSNYVQEQILTSIANRPPEAPNVFMVGDVKQSIYGFRKAKPGLFLEKYQTYEENGEKHRLIELQTNFRSRKSVLDSTNLVFSRLMQEDLGGIAYNERNALNPGQGVYQEEDGPQNRTELLLTGKDPMEEPMAVAARIKELMDPRHPFRVLDKDAGEERGIRYSDIVILMRSLGEGANNMAAELRLEGIPVSLQSRQGYFSALEVQQLLSFLKIIDNPRQDIALASVLKSPVYSFTVDDLALIRAGKREGIFYDALEDYAQNGEDPGLRGKIRGFLEDLSLFREKSRFLQIHELLAFVLEKTQFDTIVSAMPGGKQRGANIRMLFGQAVSFESTSYHGLFQFNRYMDQLQTYNIDYGEGTAVGENEDAVRIFTIHKSKGLEFPVVFLCGMGKKFNKGDLREKVPLDSKLGMGLEDVDLVHRTRCGTILRNAVSLEKETESLAEEMRVLYVAMTRAREKLFLTASCDNPQELAGQMEGKGRVLSYYDKFHASGFLDWLSIAASGREDLISVHPFTIEELSVSPAASIVSRRQRAKMVERESGIAPKEAYEEVEKAFSKAGKEEEAAFIPAKFSVSELKEESIREVDEDLYQLFEEPAQAPYVPSFMKEKKEEEQRGTAYGTAMHRVMECLDLTKIASKEDLLEQVGEMAESGRLSQEAEGKISRKALCDFLSGSLFGRMKKAQQEGLLFREKPFVMSVPAREADPDYDSDEPVLVQGIMDAYFMEGDGIVLVDYKTDRVKSPQELSARYRRQMQLYGQALEQGTGKKVKEAILYSFRLGEEVQVALSS